MEGDVNGRLKIQAAQLTVCGGHGPLPDELMDGEVALSSSFIQFIETRKIPTEVI